MANESTVPPMTAFRFEIVLTVTDSLPGVTNPVCDAAFAECTGLEMTMEPKSLTQGGDHTRQVHRIGPVTYGRLTLRRGMTQNTGLWAWFKAASLPGVNGAANGEIRMVNSDGTPALTFVLDDCLPVRLSGPSLNARTGEIAIEEIQLVYAYLKVKGLDGGNIGFGIEASASLSVGGANVSASANFSLGIGR